MLLEKLSAGLGVFLFGFSVVFICLVLIIFYILIQTAVLGKSKKTKKKDTIQEKPSNDFISQVVLDDKKEIAAIAGALAVYLGTDVGNIMIKSYRRIRSNSPAWRRAGQTDQLLNRF